jgi:hypothetical protein
LVRTDKKSNDFRVVRSVREQGVYVVISRIERVRDEGKTRWICNGVETLVWATNVDVPAASANARKREGFIGASVSKICYRRGKPSTKFHKAHMVLELAPGAAREYRGMVRYRPEFDAV